MSNKSKVVHNTAALLTSVSWQWRPKKHSTSTSAKCSLSVYSRQTDMETYGENNVYITDRVDRA